MESKRTPFYQRHIENKGRMVDFAGWALPLEYGSMLNEAKAVRTFCGLFDASHMGEIVVSGQGAFDFLQRLTTNDISLIKHKQQQYNLFLNYKGGVIDDLMIYHCKDHFFCVVNATNKNKVYDWLWENKGADDVEIIDKSAKTALICLQGPASVDVMEAVFGRRIRTLKYMYFTEQDSQSMKILISRSGYTGEDGFEIYTDWDDALAIWDMIVEKGRNFGLVLCGLGARNILRIEAGFPLYGHELSEKVSPFESSLGWVVKLNKDFVGKEEIIKAKREGLKRKRVGFIMEGRAMPRYGYQIYFQGRVRGRVSSGAYSPNISKFIGMAYFAFEYADKGVPIEIEIRNKLYRATIRNYPFVKPGVKKKI